MNQSTKRQVQLTGAILVLILMVASIVMLVGHLRRFDLEPIKPSRLNDYGLRLATNVLDEGGIGVFDEKGAVRYVLIGRGFTSQGTDYRDCYIKIDQTKEEDKRILSIHLFDPSEAHKNENVSIAENISRRPLAIYQLKHSFDVDIVRLYIDGKEAAFSDILSLEKAPV